MVPIKRKIKGQSVYRRYYLKKDGRSLFLYGYKPHKLLPLLDDHDAVAKGGGFGGCIVACIP